EYGRGHEVARVGDGFRAAGDEPCAVLLGALDEATDRLELIGRGYRSECGRRVERVAGSVAPDPFANQVDGFVVACRGDEHACPCCTRLTAVEESLAHTDFHRGGQVGVVQDD